MSIHRVALIFDDRIRPDTTGVYVRKALAGLVEVVHYQPGQVQAIPSSGFDLYLSIDDDTEHRLPESLHPRAYWAIDTHRDFPARFGRSVACDLVFAAQRDGAERLRNAGIESASWLPLACDPDIHRKHEVPRRFDVGFVGHRCPGPRDELLELIRREFPDHFLGNAFFDEMARIYSASRVVFNRSIRNDVNMRVFEAMACGSLLVTNDLAENGQDELFRDRVHFATYREPGEMLETIGYYLAHEDEREAIAASGRAEVVARHTYRHRMGRLLAESEARLSRTVAGGLGAHLDGVVPNASCCAWEETPHPPCGHPLPAAAGRGGRGASHPAIQNPKSKIPNGEGLASVIVPCFNQCAFTRHCLQALFRFTRPAWELIVVDNGSTDETAAYLNGVQDASGVPVTVVTNAQNVGFPAAINQGLQLARGEYLVLLNNDAVVTDGWLDHLIALTTALGVGSDGAGHEPIPPEGGTPAGNGESGSWSTGFSRPTDRRPKPIAGIGLVGPVSNYATPPQLVEDVPYRDLDQMHAFAGRWRDEHRGKWFTAGKLSGFCVLLTRAVYDAVGGLDERFGLGFFDDDDLAERARRAGFELAVAQDLFVHHFGSRTFAGNGIDASALLDENARRFADKWGHETPRGRRVSLRPWDGNPEFYGKGAERNKSQGQVPSAPSAVPPLRLCVKPVRSARISLTMIVRDEEENLPHCLESVRGIFDEIVVVDTGSVDRTRDIALSLGANVFEFAWVDDFAAARNVALSQATGDYAFWLDADDVVDPPEREKLEMLLDGLRPGEPTGYVVRCACDPSHDGSGGETVVDHIRLFPLRDDVRWSYRVHEQIMPALRRADIPVRWTDLVVRHTGYVDLALRGRKLDRDAKILSEELKERPEDPFVLFNLGAIAIERRDWVGALEFLRRSLRGSAPTDSITRKLFALIARAHQMMGDTALALRACAEGLSFDAEDAEFWFRKGVVHRQRGESAEAESSWRRILGLTRPERFASLDMGIYGHLTRRNLAVLARERGDLDEEDRLWRDVLAECPGDREALARLNATTAPTRSWSV